MNSNNNNLNHINNNSTLETISLESKIENIKLQIQQGTYLVNNNKLAESILKNVPDLLFSDEFNFTNIREENPVVK